MAPPRLTEAGGFFAVLGTETSMTLAADRTPSWYSGTTHAASRLHQGIVEDGLFLRMADAALIAGGNGVTRLARSRQPRDR